MALPVLGGTHQIESIINNYAVDVLLIAMPSKSGDVIREIIEQARSCEVEHKIIPSIHELISGKVSVNEIRDVDVEDLLKVESLLNSYTNEIAGYLKNQTVLVTGAGGFVGSEIVRQILPFGPQKLIFTR
ncbi:MAG: hypothetical protein U5K31_02700 [Balneolaceae bacterium]|nr:hypothetical protein [Balneolaceae bacterium]